MSKINERQLYSNSVQRKYTLQDLSKWIKYGISIGVISKDNSKENVDNIMKWIDVLDKGNINV